jgi:3-oxoacyl-[acyl-carrier protein] reductase
MVEIDLNGRVSLVTGASRGLGRAIAISLATAGSKVIINYYQNDEAASTVVKEIEAIGVEVEAIKADVRDNVAVKSLLKRIIERWGKINILVNNAGIVKNELLLRLSEGEWDEVIDTSLKGAFLCSKYALRSMIEQEWGRIINISSVAALRGNYGQTNYSSAKGGLISFTRSLAREVGSRGITVNAITPGLMQTDMMQTVPESYCQDVMSRLAIPRVGTPQDVAELVTFLASNKASYITAQVIGVDGGLV